MSKETKPKKTRSTKKSNKAELEAKIAELEAKIAGLSSQVKPSEARPSQTRAPPPDEVAPAYVTTSSTRYTGNKYYATRARLAYHSPDKQFKSTTTTARLSPPPAPEPEYAPKTSKSSYDTQREEMKPRAKRSLWKAKGAYYEDYASEHERRAPSPPPREEPKPRPAPKHEVAKKVEMPQAAGEVAPAYATTSSTGYTGNRYYATRRRLAYHPPSKQFTGASTSEAPPAPAPETPKPRSRGTLPAGFKT